MIAEVSLATVAWLTPLLTVIGLLWLGIVPSLLTAGDSDAAGNAMGAGFTALGAIGLWVLLGVLVLVAALTGQVPPAVSLTALVLVPASGAAALAAGTLLQKREMAPYRWPIVIPAFVPPCIVAFALWAVFPALRTRVPALWAVGANWGPVFALTVAILPMRALRSAALDRLAAESAAREEAFARLPADAPLSEWLPFIEADGPMTREERLKKIRQLERRQADAEAMLARGDVAIFEWMARLDLTPSPTLFEAARGRLLKRARELTLDPPGTKPYDAIAMEVLHVADAMEWLVGYGCACEAERRAWIAMVKTYSGETNWDAIRIGRLSEPGELGRRLREDPERFEMLTPEAHLRGWLKFVDRKGLRDRVLEGASKLPSRNADALAMLGGRSYDYDVLCHMPALDLTPSPALFEVLRKIIRERVAEIYRPKPGDEPRPYLWLQDQIEGRPHFAALQWLVAHGCDCAAEVSEIETTVRGYEDSPARAAMLEQLAKLRAPA